MSERPWLLAETPWSTVREIDYALAVLPWGATEAHNLHLPYGTDVIESERVAAAAAELAWKRGTRVVVLPAVPFGMNSGQIDIPLTIHMGVATQLAVLRDVAASLERQGVRRLLILNGHGGNDFRPLIRDLQLDGRLLVCTADWYRLADANAFFAEPGDHAGELETSVMLHLAPALVLPLDRAGSGAARAFASEGLRSGLAWAPRRWTQVTRDTGVGDPSRGTAEKGRLFLDAVCDRLAALFSEIAALDPDDPYEPPPAETNHPPRP